MQTTRNAKIVSCCRKSCLHGVQPSDVLNLLCLKKESGNKTVETLVTPKPSSRPQVSSVPHVLTLSGKRVLSKGSRSAKIKEGKFQLSSGAEQECSVTNH